MRDLVRARATAAKVLSKARQHLSGFLLRHGKIYSGVRTWTQAYRRWLTTVRFDHPGQQVVLQDYIDAVITAELWHRNHEQSQDGFSAATWAPLMADFARQVIPPILRLETRPIS
jgi:hypothetical protein